MFIKMKDINLIHHNKKFGYYLIKCEFKLKFNDYEYCPYVMSNISDNRKMISWKSFWKKCLMTLKIKDILSII